MTNSKEPPFKGRFIALDGPDYCGKGTQHRKLVNYLLDHPRDREQKLINVVATREPFNTKHQQHIRTILRESGNPYEKAQKITTLFVEDRKIHVQTLILPCIASGCIVVSDRYKYSTLAYQSAQGIPLNTLQEMHQDMPIPDLTLFIDVPLEERLQRKALDRKRNYDEMFEKDSSFQKKLDANYTYLKETLVNEPIVVIDGKNKNPDEVFTEIQKHVDALLFRT